MWMMVPRFGAGNILEVQRPSARGSAPRNQTGLAADSSTESHGDQRPQRLSKTCVQQSEVSEKVLVEGVGD